MTLCAEGRESEEAMRMKEKEEEKAHPQLPPTGFLAILPKQLFLPSHVMRERGWDASRHHREMQVGCGIDGHAKGTHSSHASQQVLGGRADRPPPQPQWVIVHSVAQRGHAMTMVHRVAWLCHNSSSGL